MTFPGQIKQVYSLQSEVDMERVFRSSADLAARITKAASRQTYYTVRFLVDRDRIPNAYRAYAYFRWVDDRLDQASLELDERLAFVAHQAALIDDCYRRECPSQVTPEEQMVVDLIQSDPESDHALHAYIHNLLAVMAFDAGRKDRLVSQEELNRYTHCLATAVTEALHYFIGHNCASPHTKARYLAATAAHITHMLRDTMEDVQAGYFNIPREVLDAHGISPSQVGSDTYRAWVRSRVQLARRYFQGGRDYLRQVENLRCRIAGYAYIARFDGVLDSIERDGYLLRNNYPERKYLENELKMGWSVLAMALNLRRQGAASPALGAH
jgi:phytoene/squalene synthetase